MSAASDMGVCRFTKRADRDLIDIYRFTAVTFGLAQAERYAESMRSCFAMLAANPRVGRRADAVRPGLRRHEHGAHVIFYREDAGSGDVVIVTVLHARMRPDLAAGDLL